MPPFPYIDLMIKIYTKQKQLIELQSTEELLNELDNVIWIDLQEPLVGEIASIENIMNIRLPSRDEMYGLEISNRLYQEKEAFFVTAFVVVKSDSKNPDIQPVTFILVKDKLITVRYVDPQPFKAFVSSKDKITAHDLDGKDVLLCLLENIIERISDIMEKYIHELDALSRKVFRPSTPTIKGRRNKTNYEKILKDIGFYGDVLSKSRESLMSIIRLVAYVKQSVKLHHEPDELTRLEILEVDGKALSDHATFITNKINFLLDAALGMISIQQNNIIKIFTVATMVFLPPTLIASVYGMNFKFMPELNWDYGYVLALTLMALSAYVPYVYFKKKGWL